MVLAAEYFAHVVLSSCVFVQFFFKKKFATSMTVHTDGPSGGYLGGVAGHNQDQRFLRVPEREYKLVFYMRGVFGISYGGRTGGALSRRRFWSSRCNHRRSASWLVDWLMDAGR